MNKELKNCPCCNNTAEIIINKEDEFRIKCPRCGLMTESCDKEAEDVVKSIKRDWNRRQYNDSKINDLNYRIENLQEEQNIRNNYLNRMINNWKLLQDNKLKKIEEFNNYKTKLTCVFEALKSC